MQIKNELKNFPVTLQACILAMKDQDNTGNERANYQLVNISYRRVKN